MTKVGVLSAEQYEAAAKLLSGLTKDVLVEICDVGQAAPDILIIDKAPDQNIAFKGTPKIVIANSDDEAALGYAYSLGGQIITNGFNSKAAVTA